MKRNFYIEQVAVLIASQPIGERAAIWHSLEHDYAAAWREAHPDAPAPGYESDWLALAQDVGRRLAALESGGSRPILRLRA